jgi:hypothetical protein
MARYAEGTDVSISRSVAELEKLVTKYGASGFGYGRDDADGFAQVVFRIQDRVIRFRIQRPDPRAAEFRLTPSGRSRSIEGASELVMAEEKRRWRGLVLVIKALLVAVADDVLTLSDAFLPYTMLPAGTTFGEWAAPQLDVIAATQEMPSLLPGGSARAIEGRS